MFQMLDLLDSGYLLVLLLPLLMAGVPYYFYLCICFSLYCYLIWLIDHGIILKYMRLFVYWAFPVWLLLSTSSCSSGVLPLSLFWSTFGLVFTSSLCPWFFSEFYFGFILVDLFLGLVDYRFWGVFWPEVEEFVSHKLLYFIVLFYME